MILFTFSSDVSKHKSLNFEYLIYTIPCIFKNNNYTKCKTRIYALKIIIKS